MSKVLYDFITESFLYHGSDTMWRSYSDQELFSEVTRYKEHARDSFQTIVTEHTSQRQIKVFAGFQMPEIALLSQMAPYLDVFYVYDPLFAFDWHRDPYSMTMNRYLGYRGHDELDRQKLKTIVEYLKAITPFVVSEYVKLVPFDLSPDFSTGMPITFSENYFDELLPEDLRGWFHSRAVVRTLVRSDRGWQVTDDLVPSRAITINFGGEELQRTRIYHLLEQEIVSIDEQTKTFTARMHLPSSPPNRAYFNARVHQSINRSAHQVYSDTFYENLVCARLGNTSYMTDTALISDLLEFRFNPKETVADAAANLLLRLDLPAIQGASPATLMEVRDSLIDSFQRFRSELERRVFQLRTITDTSVLDRKIADFSYELTDTNIRDIQVALKGLKKSLLLDALLVTGSLTTSILAGGWGLIPSAIAAIQGIRTYDEYKSKVRSNPSFFYWKIQRRETTSA